jgi:putative copper export protein
MLRGLGGLYISAMLVLGLSYIGLGWIGQGHDIPDLEVRRRALAVGITHMYSYSAGALLILAMGVRALQLRYRAAKGSGASQGPDFG